MVSRKSPISPPNERVTGEIKESDSDQQQDHVFLICPGSVLSGQYPRTVKPDEDEIGGKPGQDYNDMADALHEIGRASCRERV